MVTIQEAARAAGLSRQVLMIWEARYGWPQPVRDRHGARLYSDGDVRDLTRVARWLQAGHKIGSLIRDGVLVGPPRCRCVGPLDVLARTRFPEAELEDLRAAIVAGLDTRVEQLRAAIACRLHPRLRPTAWRLVRIAETLRDPMREDRMREALTAWRAKG